MYLIVNRKPHWIATIPAIFMTAVTITYILNAEIGFGLSRQASVTGGVAATIVVIILFAMKAKSNLAVPLVSDVEVDDEKTA